MGYLECWRRENSESVFKFDLRSKWTEIQRLRRVLTKRKFLNFRFFKIFKKLFEKLIHWISRSVTDRMWVIFWISDLCKSEKKSKKNVGQRKNWTPDGTWKLQNLTSVLKVNFPPKSGRSLFDMSQLLRRRGETFREKRILCFEVVA